MFSPALGRVIRSTSNITLSTSAVCSIKRPISVVASQQLTLTRPPHPHIPQRRFSSSKASQDSPNSGASGKTPTSNTSTRKASTTTTSASKASKASSSATTSQSKSTGGNTPIKGSRKKSRVPVPPYNVPFISPVLLTEEAVKEASFYNLHRPLSPTALFPKSTTTTNFDKIFEPSSTQLFHGLRHGEDAVQKYAELNGALPRSAEPETPLGQQGGVLPLAPGQQQTDTVTIYVSSLPTVEMDGSVEDERAENIAIRQPRLERETRRNTLNRIRNTQERGGMWAISVKRQRKLKMKKHKYKKLMKRTRLERKKLGRL